jgi:subtilisin family serine protease
MTSTGIFRYVAVTALLFTFLHPVYAQKDNWQNLDLQKDTVFGLSTEKAYTTLLQHKKSHPVIVGVIDSGVDTAHEDLKAIIWTNPKEIPNNGIDDDHDGYVDDVHGWDFIGGPKGDVAHDNLEMVRLVRDQQPFYDSLTKAGSIPEKYKAGYDAYTSMYDAFQTGLKGAQQPVEGISRFKGILDSIVKNIGKDTPTLADFQNYTPATGAEQRVKSVVVENMQGGMSYTSLMSDGIMAPLKHYQDELDYYYNLSFDPRPIVGDDYNNSSQRDYGNADCQGPEALHGTHVAGIIGAIRHNGLGIDGIADNVQIMAVRVVPDGDERDKDVANGIRFAADHGAKVINMSFGKSYAKDKAAVDAAVKYAISKDVLLIHAAGNEGADLDAPGKNNYPNQYYADGSGTATAWITVGASGWIDDSTLVAPFSNYGKKSVDVFAPGEQIYSTIPGSKYIHEDGTSMASPVVAGLAALIREYYPKLTAVQVKQIILQSVVKPTHPVVIGSGETRRVVSLSDISTTGGVVNAYQALLLAETFKR